jgi:hypothetical protein
MDGPRSWSDPRLVAWGPHPKLGVLAVGLALALALSGCQKHIGDDCVLSTDCSIQGNRQCDTSQPGGYCTQFFCNTNSCPDNAACILFEGAVPGCAYDDYESPARTARSLCMKTCGSDGDCRDGYVCRDPKQPPWNAEILDDWQHSLVCIVPPDQGIAGVNMSVEDAAVCQPTGPKVPGIDASTNVVEAGGGDATVDAPADGPADGPSDATGDADAGDSSGVDATGDGEGDAGSSDAAEGG